MKKIKVLLADDHVMFLKGLKSVFEETEHINVIDAVLNSASILEVLERETVDILITDLNMPNSDVFALNLTIKKKYPKTKVLVLSSFSNPDEIGKLIKNDVDGYLIKDSDPVILLEAIQKINDGEKYFSEDVKNKYINSIFSSNKDEKSAIVLTKRETEIIQLIAKEYSTAEISKELYISDHTVNTHRKNLLAKLRVKNTAGLVKYALKNGLSQME